MNKQEKSIICNVVSTKGQQTVVIEVTRLYRHPLYKKQIRRTRRLAAHNESMELLVGDKIMVVPTRPMSRTKHYKVSKKII